MPSRLNRAKKGRAGGMLDLALAGFPSHHVSNLDPVLLCGSHTGSAAYLLSDFGKLPDFFMLQFLPL